MMRTRPLADVPEALEAVRQHPLLRSAPDLAQTDVLAGCRVGRLMPGEILTHRLDGASMCFLMLSGLVETLGGDEFHPHRVGTLESGALIGEVGVLTARSQAIIVRAVAESCVVEISRDHLFYLIGASGEAGIHLLGWLGTRLAQTNRVFDELAYLLKRGITLRGAVPQTRSRKQAALSRLFERLVRSRLHRVEFLALVSFLLTAGITRLLAVLVPTLQESVLFLKGTYLSGFLIFILSTIALFLTAKHKTVRNLAIALGFGGGLVVNNLSLLLAFDIFYPQVALTRTPSNFSYAILYQRSESFYAMLAVVSVLLVLTYCRDVFRVMALLLRGALWSFPSYANPPTIGSQKSLFADSALHVPVIPK